VALAERTLAVAAAARRAGVFERVELWVEPGTPAGALGDWSIRYQVTVHEQRGANLGERMHAALSCSLAQGRGAVLIGTDVPGFDVPYLAEAAAALKRCDAVIGPAEDGGYVLVALARDVDAFSGVAWSTASVLEATRANLQRAGATWHELPPLWDVDTHDDWGRWRREAVA
jgi:rSAM/selenodomain-associated transferase 1